MSSLKTICPNMTKANKFISNIINSFIEGGLIENRYITTLVKHHPTKNIDINNIEWFKMKRRLPFNNLALFYKYKNNNKEDDISWKLCIRNLFGKYNRNKDYEHDVKMAFRHEIFYGIRKQYCIDNTYTTTTNPNNPNYGYIGKCSNCKLTGKITIDHYHTPYKRIFDDFINDIKINLSDIDIFENERFEIRFKDKELANKWLKYHDNRVNYRLLCKSCNSHFGCYGYK